MFFKKTHTLTPVQAIFVAVLVTLFVITSVDAMAIYDNEEMPSGTMFHNSQTLEVFRG